MKPFKHLFAIIGVIAVFALVTFAIWFMSETYFDPPPQFFPFNRTDAEYIVVKDGEYFQIKYKGPDAFPLQNKDASGYISVMVGETKYDLNEYIGKSVILTKGKFDDGFTSQCIAEKCVSIGGPYVAVVIEEMKFR